MSYFLSYFIITRPYPTSFQSIGSFLGVLKQATSPPHLTHSPPVLPPTRPTPSPLPPPPSQASTMLPLGSLAVAVADVAAEALPTVREPGTGVEFPVLLSDAGEGAGEVEKAEKEGKKGKKGGKEGKAVTGDRTLAGVGVRNKNLLGLKNIKVYAYGESSRGVRLPCEVYAYEAAERQVRGHEGGGAAGQPVALLSRSPPLPSLFLPPSSGVYVDEGALKKQLSGKYGGMKGEVLRGSRWLVEDAITADVTMAVRLVIFYRHLKMGQVREAFNEC
ncbi:unnamed protein product [Closterium sp. NIES-54]